MASSSRRVLLVGLVVHHVEAVRVPVQHLKLLGVEPGVVDEFGGAQAGIERVARVEIPETDLDERPEIAGGPVLEVHHAARSAADHENVAAADVGSLHAALLKSMMPAPGDRARAAGRYTPGTATGNLAVPGFLTRTPQSFTYMASDPRAAAAGGVS